MLSDSHSLKGDTWIICNKRISLISFGELTSILFRSLFMKKNGLVRNVTLSNCLGVRIALMYCQNFPCLFFSCAAWNQRSCWSIKTTFTSCFPFFQHVWGWFDQCNYHLGRLGLLKKPLQVCNRCCSVWRAHIFQVQCVILLWEMIYLDFFGKLLGKLLLSEEVTKPLLLSCFGRKSFSGSSLSVISVWKMLWWGNYYSAYFTKKVYRNPFKLWEVTETSLILPHR